MYLAQLLNEELGFCHILKVLLILSNILDNYVYK